MATIQNKRNRLARLTPAERAAEQDAAFAKHMKWWKQQIADGVILDGFASIEGNLMKGLHGYATLMKTHRVKKEKKKK